MKHLTKEEIAEKRISDRYLKKRKKVIRQVRKLQDVKKLDKHTEYMCSMLARGF